MKQKAFTLIELLAVIVILALIALVVFPAINNVLSDSKKDAYKSQINIIEKAAKEYYLEHINELPENGCNSVEISELISQGYIASDDLEEGNIIIDPRTDKQLTGVVEVRDEKNQYSYTFRGSNEEVCKQEESVEPNPEEDPQEEPAENT